MQMFLKKLFNPRMVTLPIRRLLPNLDWKNILTINGRFRIVNLPSFLSIYDEIYIRGVYRNINLRQNAVIMDFGANIGMVSYYFAKRYPESKIFAYEPDINIFQILGDNLAGIPNVKTVNKAVSIFNGTSSFSPDGAAGGALADNGAVEVLVQSIFEIIKSKDRVDLMKIDIEGHEHELFRDPSWLSGVENLYIEIHSEHEDFRDLFKILQTLVEYGFKVEMESERPLSWGFHDGKSFTGQFLVQAYGKG